MNTHQSIDAGLMLACCSCLWLPSPQSTMNVAPGKRTTVQLTLRCDVGMPEDVPNHVTARPAQNQDKFRELFMSMLVMWMPPWRKGHEFASSHRSAAQSTLA